MTCTSLRSPCERCFPSWHQQSHLCLRMQYSPATAKGLRLFIAVTVIPHHYDTYHRFFFLCFILSSVRCKYVHKYYSTDSPVWWIMFCAALSVQLFLWGLQCWMFLFFVIYLLSWLQSFSSFGYARMVPQHLQRAFVPSRRKLREPEEPKSRTSKNVTDPHVPFISWIFPAPASTLGDIAEWGSVAHY